MQTLYLYLEVTLKESMEQVLQELQKIPLVLKMVLEKV
jgi:hypothetical protein